MKAVLHPASERGQANFGWLNSRHSFSFGQFHDPAKVNFGALRVLNDDIVTGGAGFGTHAHDNMEIVSIPLSGALAHKDSTGTARVIETGDVQIMSAGSGISHSEYNADKTQPVNFLQVWVFPKLRDITPRYDQKSFASSGRQHQWQVVVSPQESNETVWINQDAQFSLAELEAGRHLDYTRAFNGSGVYFFVIEGSVKIDNITLGKRDGLGISEAGTISITATEKSYLLAIEVPL
jgi:redox-sensitive bicupin YhaK (pirin superfamily)